MNQPTGFDKLALQSPFLFIHRSGPIPVVFYFPLRPQQVAIDLPSRGMVHQTIDSNFLDFFPGPRAVLARVSLRGTFGYSKKFGGIGITMSGAAHTKTLETIYETFNALGRQVQSRLAARQEFAIPGRGYYWRVHVESVGTRIANNDPLLFYYELSFLRLTDYLSPGGGGIRDLLGSFVPSGALGSAVSSVAGWVKGLF